MGSVVAERTIDLYTQQCRSHVLPALGARKLRDLRAEDVGRWLSAKSASLSTRTLQILHSCLNRATRRAMARDKVKRNVVELCSVPTGRAGRPSKALTMAQAEAVLTVAERTRMRAYIVLSLLTGARTEELRALTWDHVYLEGDPRTNPPIPPYVAVWRSERAGGDTKTLKSRRTLALPGRCVDALHKHRAQQDSERAAAGKRWREYGLVFASTVGTPLDPSHVRRDFRKAIREATGVDPAKWPPCELRHSFVSLLSDNGIPLEEISRLVGHTSTATTEAIYARSYRSAQWRWTAYSDHHQNRPRTRPTAPFGKPTRTTPRQRTRTRGHAARQSGGTLTRRECPEPELSFDSFYDLLDMSLRQCVQIRPFGQGFCKPARPLAAYNVWCEILQHTCTYNRYSKRLQSLKEATCRLKCLTLKSPVAESLKLLPRARFCANRKP